MAQMNNSLQQVTGQNAVAKKQSFSAMMQTPAFKQAIQNTLQDKGKCERFTTGIISAVSTNETLQECEAGSILSSALLGETLGLSPSPQLGHYYMVPFNQKKKIKNPDGTEREYVVKKAQFQLGYKGFVQLALRSGQYKGLNVIAIKEGELIRYDRLNDEVELNYIGDDEQREKMPTIGYVAYFELVNGFKKTMYWSKKKMEAHALKYSQGYKTKKGYTFWEKDFDGMAYKTMLRQLISKWGIMSIELQNAYESDMAVLNPDGSREYVDNNNDFGFVQNADYEEKQVEVKPQTTNTFQPF